MIASNTELLHITQVYAAAMMAVIIWDWLVSLGEEYRSIWKTEWNLVKVLYLISRYWTLGALSFSLWAFTATFEHDACVKVIHWIPATCAVITLSTECILAVRTYALWGRPRWLLGVVSLCLLVELAFMIWGSAIIEPVFPAGVLGPCVPTSSAWPNYLYFLSPFVVDVIFTGLCFYKAIQIAKVGQVTEILKLFLRDGSMYFVIVSLANVVQTGFFIQPHTGMKVINAFAALGLSSMMCCRLVLSLKSFDAPHNSSERFVLDHDTELSQRTAHSSNAKYPVFAKTETHVATDSAQLRNSVPLLATDTLVIDMSALAMEGRNLSNKTSTESIDDKGEKDAGHAA
ncbi:MAG: hypothetical protein CYPHOPRED_003436 [Cyphobasidiales sp. Tagirdzhanova-0007]|nr:MAG: hypothetical protein CYPHOPRED_003436 [Cyphobasidiales sp. Tagirdzhanova-0007]